MTTYYVSSEIGSNNNAGTSQNAPLATLQAAANMVQPGDTVEVMNGTYTAPAGGNVLTITTSGTAAAPITFEAAPGQTPIINSSGGWNGIDIEASYIVIDGFTVTGDAANYTLAQALAGYSTGNAALDGNGISATGNHIIIEGNTVYNEPGGGIGAQGADYVQILNNVVYDNAHWSAYGNSGISIYDSKNSDTAAGIHDVVSGNTVYGNAQLVPTSGAGEITDGEGIILDTNTGYTGEILVENNTVYDNGSSGIESFLTNGAVITGNTVYGNNTGNVQPTSDAEIFINQSNNNTATNNNTTAPDVTPPAAPVISTGAENSNETVTLTGSAPAGSLVTLSDGGTAALGTATATAGSWSFTTAALSAGSYAFTATDTISAETSAASSAYDVTVTPPAVAPPVDDTNHTIANDTTLTITTAAAGTETFAGHTGTLVLDDALGFAGTIAGFRGDDALVLSDMAFGQNTTLAYTATGSTSGVLSVSDGAQTATIAMLGHYMASSFVAASDGFGGTLITEAAQTTSHAPLTPSHHFHDR
jgi:hypothetical protein